MKKSILNLGGVQQLTKKEQKAISGSGARCEDELGIPKCPPGYCCKGRAATCYPLSSLHCGG